MVHYRYTRIFYSLKYIMLLCMYVYIIIIYSNYYNYKCDNNKITTNVQFVFYFLCFIPSQFLIWLNFIVPSLSLNYTSTTFRPCDNICTGRGGEACIINFKRKINQLYLIIQIMCFDTHKIQNSSNSLKQIN